MASDIELLHAWHDSRDAEAFKELTRRYAGLVHAAAKRILGNEATAEDVTQESFERLAMTTHPPQGPIAPWLHRVATNRALDRIRAEQTRRRREQQYANEHADETPPVVWEDVYAHVDAAVNALPEKLRMPMVEHFYRDRSAADIAGEMGLTRQAVSYRIRKGVESVRRTLRKRGFSAGLASLAALMSANLAEAAPLPASLTTNLGKLAVAGVVGSNLNTAATAATVFGGVLIMKKVIVVGAVVIVAVLGIWALPKVYVPKAEPSPPSYVPRTAAAEPAPVVAQETEEPAAEPVTPTGDITGRFYNIVTGEGIQGVRPEVIPVEHASITGRPLDVEGSDSDASGNYKLTGLEPGQYGVRAPQVAAYPWLRSKHYPAMGSLLITVAADSVVRDVNFGLEPGASVSGVVLSSDGEPVEGAKVTGRPIDTTFRETTMSRPDGTFELFVAVHDGTVELQARKDDLYSPVVDSLSFSYGGLKDVVLEVTEAQTASISGLVFDSSSRPVEGAIVTVYGDALPLDAIEFPRSVETTHRGTFQVDQLLAGDYRVFLAPPGSISRIWAEEEVARLTLRAGQTIDGLRFSLGVNLSISGRVVDPSGKAIEDATVLADRPDSLQGQSEGYATSGADGQFVLAGLEDGEYSLLAHRREESTFTKVGTFPTGAENLKVVLADLGSIEGCVVRADTGEPLTHFRIYIHQRKILRLKSDLFHVAHGGALTYDPEGRFVRECFRGSQGDGIVTVIAVSPGFAPNLENVQIPEDGAATGVELRLEPSRLVEGRVIDTFGHPVAGAKISWGDVLEAGNTSRVVACSDSSGFFSVESIPADEHILSAFHPSFAPSAVRVASRVTIVLEAGGMLKGRVWAKEGGPHNVRCVLARSPGLPGGGCFRDFPGPNGHYRLAGIPAGAVDMTLFLDPKGRIERKTHIVSGQTRVEDFEVVLGGATVHGQILGEGIDPEQVYLELTVTTPEGDVSTLEGDMPHRTRGTADGTYLLTGVTPGWAKLKAKAYIAGGPSRTRVIEFEIANDNPVVQDITFGPGCTVAGTFAGLAQGRTGVVTALEGDVDLSGLVTVEDIQAYLPEANATTMGQVVCDPLGQYVLQGLSPGTYTLVAVTIDATDDQDIAQWRWTFAVITLQEDGETQTMDFDFR